MPERPLLIGLTGSMGMGKTETAKMFARLGIPVYDADASVHALYGVGGAAVIPIAHAFPGAVKDKQVDRAVLAKLVSGDAAAFKRLEAIVHPLVAERQQEFIEEAANKGAELVVLDIPLLFETGGDAKMDAVVVVSAPMDTQRQRILAREGMTEVRMNEILARQTPDAEKRARAHYGVESGHGYDRAFEQVQAIVRELRAVKKRQASRHA
jgi:dephospho-CoA kinase